MAKNRGMAALVVLLTGMSVPLLSAAEPPLAHAVYFTLKDRSETNRQSLVKGCEKYLSGHEGTAYFAVGTLAAEFQREVNDRQFDVFLLVIFRDKAAHEAYQVDPRHLKFVEEYSGLWEKVRVFDSFLGTPAR